MTRVSIVVPTVGRASLATTLDALLAEQRSVAEAEILIVENGPQVAVRDAVSKVAAACPPQTVRYIHDPLPGLLTGRHRGALEAKGDLLVFVDDDTEVGPGWLKAIVHTFADDTVQLAGGPSLPRYEVPPPPWVEAFRRPTPYGGWALGDLSLLDLGDRLLDIDANWIWGLNFAIRRQALLDLGGFHPDILPDHLQHFQGDGETGLTMKANERGYRAVYQPWAVVYHHIPRTRLTPEYFERRAFFQGVCDSFTHIRRARGIDLLHRDGPWESRLARLTREALRVAAYARHPVRHGWNFTRRMGARTEAALRALAEDREVRAIKRRVERAYHRGYAFHQEAVRRQPLLLEWVLRPDYWDCRLPSLPSLEGCQRAGTRTA